ncbi:MAG: cytochrome c [Chloracidobacterium sp.]|nr:cytochrome c [Chloracidobacterium sp.]MCO5333107.1 cytochrome c [Pyrinomonadaceae bacterium]
MAHYCRRRFLTPFVIAAATVLLFAACSQPEPSRYSIVTDRSYEATLYRQNCAVCHGSEGLGAKLDTGMVVPNLREGPHQFNTREEIYEHITNGGQGMMPFRNVLTDRERYALTDFIMNNLRNEKK